MDDSVKKWQYIVFNKEITEDESLKFYETWAKTVRIFLNKVTLIK
jgi:hypothetical protein